MSTPNASDEPLAIWSVEDTQLELLETIWATMPGQPEDWPTWDYVRRTLRQRTPPLDAQALWDSLPSVRRPDGRGTYGLTWRSQDQTPAVQPYERVGLSIAGLAQLSARWPAARAYADKLAGFVRVLAVEEHSLFPDPNAVADTARELDSLLSKMFLEVADTSAFTVTAQVSYRVLQREPIYLGLFDPELPTAPSTTVTLSEYLQPYIGSYNAAEYLQVVAEQTPPEPVTITMPPSSLPQTLDYLTLVLREDPNWPTERRLVAPRDLTSAAALSMGATTRDEFDSRMTSLALVLGGLHPPDYPDISREQTLARLQRWIEERCVADPAARQRVVAAIADVRAAIHIRAGIQHTNDNANRQARAARTRLGLPQIITNYADAWDIVRSRVAAAFDVIREQTQLAAAST